MDIDFSQPLKTVTDKLEGWIDGFILMLPNMVIAVLLFLLFYAFAKIGKKFSHKLFKRATQDEVIQHLLASMVKYLIFGLGIFLILGILNLEKAVTSLLAGVGVLGLVLGIAFQDIMANFISGIILAFRKPFRIGDIVELSDTMGTVVRNNLRSTALKTFQGQEVYIPNKAVIQNKIINYSALGQRRIDIPVGISYGDDLNKVKKVVLEAIKQLKGIIREDDIIFDYFEFGSSSINFNIRFWIKYPDQPGFLEARSQAVIAIKKAFDKNDITIPFPIRTLDFGIKGGEKLSDLNLENTISLSAVK